MNYNSLSCAPEKTFSTESNGSCVPREDSLAGMIQEQSKLLNECRAVLSQILSVLCGDESRRDFPPPDNLLANACANLELTKDLGEAITRIRDYLCG